MSAKNFAINHFTDSQSFLDKLQKDEKGFLRLAEILKKNAGINMVLNDKNLTLMASRLNTLLKNNQIVNYKDYAELLEKPNSQYMAEFIVSLTTNTTQFFREPAHFTIMTEKLTEIFQRKEKQKDFDLRIWCSASSTGQEVYTMMMVIQNHPMMSKRWNIRFLATDIDYEVLQKAANGLYQEGEIQGIPDQYLQKYFQGFKDDSGKKFQMKPEYRELVRFATFNLLTEKYPFKNPFDIVFCRNVLIYFDRPTAEGVIEKLARSLGTGGYLFLGHSETGMMRTKLLKTVSNGVYFKFGS